jgi:hypothetical protein
MAAALQELAMLQAWTPMSSKVGKAVIGLSLVYQKTRAMEWRTLRGNMAILSSGMVDAKWNFYISVCQVCILPLLVWFAWISHSMHTVDGGDPRPVSVARCDDVALGILALVYSCRVYLRCVSSTGLTLFWIARRQSGSWNSSRTMNVLDVLLAPRHLMDDFMLDHYLNKRRQDRCFKDFMVMHAGNSFTFNASMFEKVVNEAHKLLHHPKVDLIDSHTKVFLRFVKAVVEGGRADPVSTEKIKQPFRKRPNLRNWESPIAGIVFAESDEHYSKEGVNTALDVESTEFTLSRKSEIAIGLHTMLPMSDDPPIWFDSELEGVVTYEALMRPFAPIANTQWHDLASDTSFSLIAFEGIGQQWLVGIEAPQIKKTFETFGPPPRELSADYQYVIDLSYLSKYEVRPRYARYGAIACFDSKKEPIAIYVCHWEQWIPRPDTFCNFDAPDRRKWDHAKFAMRASMGTGATLREHLLYTHWIVSNTASYLSRTCLERDHPVRRILRIFIFRSASVNYASAKTLMPEYLYVHRTAAFEYNSMVEALHDLAKEWKYETFPQFVEAKCLDPDLEETLPLIQDGQLYWNSLVQFVSAFLKIYYRDREAILNDAEIIAFWSAIQSTPPGPRDERDGQGVAPGYGYKLPNLTDPSTDPFQALVDYLCHVIFWVTANHELVGAVIEYFTTPMGLTTKILDETVADNGLDECGQLMADVQTYMQDLCIISMTGYSQPPLMSDWSKLLKIIPQDAEKDEWRNFRMDAEQCEYVREFLSILWTVFEDKRKNDLLAKKIFGSAVGFTGAKHQKPDYIPRHLRVVKMKKKVEKYLQLLGPDSSLGSGSAVEYHNKLVEYMHMAFMECLNAVSYTVHAKNYADTGGLEIRQVMVPGENKQLETPSGGRMINLGTYTANLLEQTLVTDGRTDHRTSSASVASFLAKDTWNLRRHPFEAFNPINLECSVSI